MDEWELRTLAAALRPELPALVGDIRAAALDELIAAALDLAPGRAKAVLRGILLLRPDPAVRVWVQARLPSPPDEFRFDVLGPTTHSRPSDAAAGPRDSWTGIDERALTFRIPALESAAEAALTEGERYTAVFMAGEEPRETFRRPCRHGAARRTRRGAGYPVGGAVQDGAAGAAGFRRHRGHRRGGQRRAVESHVPAAHPRIG